jgi:copper chaperone
MANAVLHVEGMSCAHCVKSIEEALQQIGVKAKVDLAEKKVTVEFDERKVSLAKIKQAIEEQGYDLV